MPNKAILWLAVLFFFLLCYHFSVCNYSFITHMTPKHLRPPTHASTHTPGRCGMGLAEATPSRIKNSPEDMVWLWFHWASVNRYASIQRAKWSAAGHDNSGKGQGFHLSQNRSRKPCSYSVRRMVIWEYIMALYGGFFCKTMAESLRFVFLSRVKWQKWVNKGSKGQGVSEHSVGMFSI